MPISKNFELRKKWLDQYISGNLANYTKDELLDRLNDQLEIEDHSPISKRQLDYDIDAMKELASKDHVELYYDKVARRYRYDKEGYSITGIPIDKKDIEVLTQALAILKQIQGLHQTKELGNIIDRLGERLGISTRELEHIIQFDQVPDLQGLDHLNGLLMKVIEKSVLKIYYQPFEKDIEEHIIHPYFLREYNNRWYVFGKDEQSGKIFNLPLDRIREFEEYYVPFDEKSRVNPSEYFKDIVGVTRLDKPVETIRLRLKKPRAYYALTKPIHGSQKVIEQKDDSIIIELKVIPNKELESIILSFGKDCESVR
jgi:predicted DNA-binding transcriptional regulator YafY